MSGSPEELRKEVVDLVRSCLLSAKGGVSLNQINQEYRELVGEDIPFGRLGHDSLVDFFQRARDVCRMMETNGKTILHPVSTAESAHIHDLVSHQDNGKNNQKRRNQRPPVATGRRPSQRSDWAPPLSRGGRGNRGGGPPHRYPNGKNKHVGSGRLPPRSSTGLSTVGYRPPQKGSLRPPSNNAFPPQKIGTFNFNNTRPNNTSKLPPNSGLNNSQRAKPPKNQQQNTSRSYVQDLEKYFLDKSLGSPEFKTSEMGSKKMRHRTYVSSVTANGKSFRTFPAEFTTKEAAEEAAAKLAIESLGLVDSSNNNNDAMTRVGDIDDVAHRIAELLGDKSNGVWSTRIDVEYKAKFKEVLPHNWPQLIVPSRHRLRVDMPIEERYIVFPYKTECEGEVVQNLESEEEVNGAGLNGQSHSQAAHAQPESSVEICDEGTLPPLILSNEIYWDVYITVVNSASDVVVRLLSENYNKLFEDLTTDMELYYYDYSSKLPPITEPVVGCMYAAQLDTDWHRVRVTNVHGIQVTCYFIDHGDEDILNAQNLRPIDPKFLKLPAQATSIKLAGLEDFADDDTILSHLREHLLGRSLVGEVVSRSEGCDPVVILFDTSTENDVNINKKVRDMVTKEGRGCSNALPTVGGEIIPVFLSYVSGSGDLYVQRETTTFNLIEKLIDESKNKILAEETPDTLDTSKLYLSKYHLNNQLYRAALLTSQVKDGKVNVIFIDHGNQEVIDIKDLREIGSKLLAETPSQALKCRLANIPSNYSWTPRAAEKLRNLVPEDVQVMLKVVSSSGDIPEVELYEKNENNQMSSSINTDLFGMKTLFEKAEEFAAISSVILENDDGSPLSPQDELLFSDIASLKGLVPPSIPAINDYFDVTVTLAASPSNFCVQPWRETEALELLQREMNDFYSKYRGSEITRADLSKDSFFATVHSDGFWYRIKVDKILDEQTISVKFVDYGDFSMVALMDLQPLWPQFRNLPMQAIKAFLSDIVPINGDWTPDDTIWFNKRSVDKQFVSMIKDVSNEEDGFMKIGVSLIDVSHPNQDIIIDKLLVDDKRAVYLCI